MPQCQSPLSTHLIACESQEIVEQREKDVAAAKAQKASEDLRKLGPKLMEDTSYRCFVGNGWEWMGCWGNGPC